MKITNTAILAISVAAILSGCTKSSPKCSDEGTLSLVRQIIINNLGGPDVVLGSTGQRIMEENLKIERSRAIAEDRKIKKYSCQATLVVGGLYQSIEYEVQLADNNQNIVTLNNMPIIGVFSKEAEEIKSGK